MVYQIVYTSRATKHLTAEKLEEILSDARIGNERKRVTGALVSVDDVFLQILEGEETVVRDLLDSIVNDSRHTSVKVIYEAEVDSPAFASWSMAYIAPTTEEVKAWIGFDGAEKIDSLVDHIHAHSRNVPEFLVNILDTLAS